MAFLIVIDMTLEGDDPLERVLLSYDVTGTARSAAARVCQIVFGRTRIVSRSGETRQEKGFIHRVGVVWIGQSVLVLPPPDAEELASKLRRLGARVAMAQVSFARKGLGAFRRPA